MIFGHEVGSLKYPHFTRPLIRKFFYKCSLACDGRRELGGSRRPEPSQWENFVIEDGGMSLETEQMCSDEVLAQADAFS